MVKEKIDEIIEVIDGKSANDETEEIIEEALEEPPKAKARSKVIPRTKPGTGVRDEKNKGKKIIGRTTKVGVHKTWFFILEKNETRKPKLTDLQITEFMYNQFPGRKSACFKDVGRSRRNYNLGNFGKIKVESTPRDVNRKTGNKVLPKRKLNK